MLVSIDGPVLDDAEWISFNKLVEPSEPMTLTRLAVPPSMNPLSEKPMRVEKIPDRESFLSALHPLATKLPHGNLCCDFAKNHQIYSRAGTKR